MSITNYNSNCYLYREHSIHLGVDLHGEEESEAGMGSNGVELLLKLYQPLRSEMDILEQHPATSL